MILTQSFCLGRFIRNKFNNKCVKSVTLITEVSDPGLLLLFLMLLVFFICFCQHPRQATGNKPYQMKRFPMQ